MQPFLIQMEILILQNFKLCCSEYNFEKSSVLDMFDVHSPDINLLPSTAADLTSGPTTGVGQTWQAARYRISPGTVHQALAGKIKVEFRLITIWQLHLQVPVFVEHT